MLSKTDKINLVHEFMQEIEKGIAGVIVSGKVPEHWDGYELRLYIAEVFADQVHPDMQDGRTARVRAYRNDVLERGL